MKNNFLYQKLKFNKLTNLFLYYIAFSLIIVATSILVSYLKIDWSIKLKTITMLSMVSFLLFIVLHTYIKGKTIDLLSIFTLILFLFHFGQFILFALNIEYNYFWTIKPYLNAFNNDYNILVFSCVLSNIYFIIFNLTSHVVILFQSSKFVTKKKIGIIQRIDKSSILKVGIFLFFVSLFPTILIRFKEIQVSLISGYAESLNITSNSIIRVLEPLFIPSLFLFYFGTNKKKTRYFTITMLFAYSIVLFIIGGRTESVALIITSLILLFKNKKIDTKKILIIAIALLLLLILTVATAEYRNVQNKNFANFINCIWQITSSNSIFNSFLGEMGWTASTLCYTISIVKNEGFIYGLSYLSSIFNIIPSSIDLFGLVDKYGSPAFLSGWLTEKVNFTFGTGFSIFSEAYLNFGSVGGIIPIAIIGYFISKILNIQTNKYDSPVMEYVKYYFFYSIFTLPRREFVYMLDQFVNYILIIIIIIVFFDYINKKLKNKKVKIK